MMVGSAELCSLKCFFILQNSSSGFNIIVIQTNGEFCNFYIKNSDIFYSLKEQSLFFSCLKRKENVTFVVVLSKEAV